MGALARTLSVGFLSVASLAGCGDKHAECLNPRDKAVVELTNHPREIPFFTAKTETFKATLCDVRQLVHDTSDKDTIVKILPVDAADTQRVDRDPLVAAIKATDMGVGLLNEAGAQGKTAKSAASGDWSGNSDAASCIARGDTSPGCVATMAFAKCSTYAAKAMAMVQPPDGTDNQSVGLLKLFRDKKLENEQQCFDSAADLRDKGGNIGLINDNFTQCTTDMQDSATPGKALSGVLKLGAAAAQADAQTQAAAPAATDGTDGEKPKKVSTATKYNNAATKIITDYGNQTKSIIQKCMTGAGIVLGDAKPDDWHKTTSTDGDKTKSNTAPAKEDKTEAPKKAAAPKADF